MGRGDCPIAGPWPKLDRWPQARPEEAAVPARPTGRTAPVGGSESANAERPIAQIWTPDAARFARRPRLSQREVGAREWVAAFPC
eukprot:2759490-Alexandrium_andersonii.AAC.1